VGGLVGLLQALSNTFADGSNSTYDGIDTSNKVFFGFGRTWNASIRYNF
jgi:predicted metalloendopeptidase